jgi:hypothetical protein
VVPGIVPPDLYLAPLDVRCQRSGVDLCVPSFDVVGTLHGGLYFGRHLGRRRHNEGRLARVELLAQILQVAAADASCGMPGDGPQTGADPVVAARRPPPMTAAGKRATTRPVARPQPAPLDAP